jgi:hypothetical protein
VALTTGKSGTDEEDDDDGEDEGAKEDVTGQESGSSSQTLNAKLGLGVTEVDKLSDELRGELVVVDSLRLKMSI